jgi:phenylalanine-4-hydroxylase
MKTYEMIKGLSQVYSNYTPEDQSVWKTLFDRQLVQLEDRADPEFLKAIEDIGFTDRIPDFNDVNSGLLETTGWKIRVVPGIIEEGDFFKLLANKEFPSSTWLRSINSLDYLSEPDMFHDGFGHMPLLTNKTFCEFFQRIGELGSKYEDVPEILVYLGRIYWFTVEFGLIKRENQPLRIYGAGILSSFGESEYSLSEKPNRRKFNIYDVIKTDFDNTVIQELYFVISSFEEIGDSLEDLVPLFDEVASKKMNKAK